MIHRKEIYLRQREEIPLQTQLICLNYNIVLLVKLIPNTDEEKEMTITDTVLYILNLDKVCPPVIPKELIKKI